MTGPYSFPVRILLVLAAIAIVIAFGLALLLSPTTSLEQAIARTAPATLVTIKTYFQTQTPPWIWTAILLPILTRPSWLVPLATALLCAGAAFTLATRPAPSRSHRRRG